MSRAILSNQIKPVIDESARSLKAFRTVHYFSAAAQAMIPGPEDAFLLGRSGLG
jgi:hypothetical protein